MSKSLELEPIFVETIPEILEDGKLYVSVKYGTAIHNCACGCGNKTVTPITESYADAHQWQYTNDKGSVTLHPSIGNYQFDCKSHYFVRDNKIIWL